jgi:uncharacterized integral membrane protein
MSFSAIIRSIIFVLILFVALYVGMNNVHEINFFFPIAGTTAKTPIHASAAIIFFGMFVVGVLAGTILTAGGGGGPKRKSKE